MNNNRNSDKPSTLKSTREAKGLTLELVHEATKIPLDALKAIEEGYSSRILSPFYYRGFIKIYAEFLGLDIKQMYQEYGLEEPAKPVSLAQPSAAKPSRMAPPKPNVLLEQAQEFLSSVFKPQVLMLLLKIIIGLIVLVLFVRMAGCIASSFHQKAPKKKIVYVHPRTSAPIEEKKTEAAAPAAPVEAIHEAVQAPASDKVEVAVRASKDTWLQVKADDKVVFQMTLSKGSMETWSADRHIQLAGRDLEQLDMEINGKHVGFLGGGERRIRRVMITKEGLTVKK